MDATTRWETEAIRSGSHKRANPPRPSSKRQPTQRSDRTWLTLKEAEAATGIPSNTLRKWVRKEAIDSYLESDGELALRIVALESVQERATELGREIEKTEVRSQKPKTEVRNQKSEVRAEIGDRRSEIGSEGTMLVPVDAWNKMLSQLGNLHEAGQQLAEARERAAKAETEATFLRERLKEMREADNRRPTTDDRSGSSESGEREAGSGSEDHSSESESGKESGKRETEGGSGTTTYWRYLTTGWRDRKRRSNS